MNKCLKANEIDSFCGYFNLFAAAFGNLLTVAIGGFLETVKFEDTSGFR